jgi:hypothetical protein
VDDQRVGRLVRVLRVRLAMRQADVARRAEVTQKVVSLVERGHLDGLPLRHVRRVVGAVGGSAELLVRWRGGEIDRVLDSAHATLVGATARWLPRYGWEIAAEVSYSEFGERGSIDLLAWHAATRSLLVIEVKSELTSVEELLRRHDVKVRLAPRIATQRFGWHPVAVARLLVLPAESTARRRVIRHAAVLDRAYPLRGDELRGWLRAPDVSDRPIGGVLFLRVATAGRPFPKRVRVERRFASPRSPETTSHLRPARGGR